MSVIVSSKIQTRLHPLNVASVHFNVKYYVNLVQLVNSVFSIHNYQQRHRFPSSPCSQTDPITYEACGSIPLLDPTKLQQGEKVPNRQFFDGTKQWRKIAVISRDFWASDASNALAAGLWNKSKQCRTLFVDYVGTRWWAVVVTYSWAMTE